MAAVAPAKQEQEYDDFGLPIKKYVSSSPDSEPGELGQDGKCAGSEKKTKSPETPPIKKPTPKETTPNAPTSSATQDSVKPSTALAPPPREASAAASSVTSDNDDECFEDAKSSPMPRTPNPEPVAAQPEPVSYTKEKSKDDASKPDTLKPDISKPGDGPLSQSAQPVEEDGEFGADAEDVPKNQSRMSIQGISGPSLKEVEASKKEEAKRLSNSHISHNTNDSILKAPVLSEFSHQQLTAPHEEEKADSDDGWQTMPAYASYDMYDDDDKLIAREHDTEKDETYGYAGLGGAGKGYTRVLDDEDAESETSMDDNTRYLFKDIKSTSMADDVDEQRDAVSQLQATKDLLTEGQKIAYVGVTRLELSQMTKEAESIQTTRKTKKGINLAAEALKMWAQKIMVRLYAHMEISHAEQIMIEQLAAHGVMPEDLTSVLMQNARVKNPMREDQDATPKIGTTLSPVTSPSSGNEAESPASALPAYEGHPGEEMPEVKTPSQLPSTENLDIDIRWTVLCDLFLVLIADSIYDARSRVLLERVGNHLEVPWLDICRFEKRVTDALEMQQQAEKENWNEEEHLEARKKMALKRRYVMMGLATVGGGLVIGLSAGLLAPLIGAGLAAGFTTIGVGGTSSFLAGAGGAAIITSGAAASGSFMGGRAAGRRTGSVKTFEYRPLHNNKRVNLVVTISGWMTSKVDDVRLPFSTVDAIMGDIYSILWEPELLTSMGDTINILATEALTQGLQQVLGSTILISLMAALQLPVVLSKLTYLIDNPWAVSLDRATSAGLILADSIVERNLGTRPITLVGYSLGSRVIFSCLQELARKGAFGLVQNVYLFGSPVVVNQDEWLLARTVVSGRLVNGYNRNDWILGYLFRLTNGGIRRVAGLATVDGVPDIENMDCTEFVKGHMQYRTAMPKLLRECGWPVESDEFGEIEDPDPDRHNERQRELINEIEEARKDLDKSQKKSGRFSFFSKKKKAQRQAWELYEDGKNAPSDGSTSPAGANGAAEANSGNNSGVLFDVDAIRAELARKEPAEEMPIRELHSTLPPMKLEITSPDSHKASSRGSPCDSLSHDALTPASQRNNPSLDLRSTTSYGSMPSLRKSASRTSYSYGDADGHGDEVEMTFDTWEDKAKRPEVPPKDVTPTRPGAQTSQTLPNPVIHDPWAGGDAEDEEFGKEKEISLTFA